MKKCIFLDRDGTINKYIELLHKKEDLELEKTAAEAIKQINDNGYLCIVLTNQPTIARNLCTYEEVIEINEELKRMLYTESKAYIDDIFFCPHHPDRGYPEENKSYKVECECRKPKIGMIKEAQRKYDIDLNESYLIGDSTIDIQTGKNAGLKTILVNTGLKGNDKKFNIIPDLYAENLIGAVELVLKKGGKMDVKKKEWNESYQHKDNFVFYPHEEIIRFVSKYVKKRVGISEFKTISEAKRCLDLGCGIGRHLIYLDEMEMEVFGIDLSDYAINYAKEWFKDVDKVHLIDRLTVGSVDALPYGDDYFDFVISHGVLDSMEFKTAIDGIQEVNRVLKNNGYFYFDVVSGDDFEHYREYADEELVKGTHEKNTIQSYFNYEKIKVLVGDSFEIKECVLIQRESVTSRAKNSRYHIIVKKRLK